MSRSSRQNQSFKGLTEQSQNDTHRVTVGDDEPDKPTVIKIVKKPAKTVPKEEPIDRVPHDCLSHGQDASPSRSFVQSPTTKPD